MKRLHVICQFGLGDNIYHRPFIKQLAKTHELFVETSWPELFSDLPVAFVEPKTILRTQQKNIARHQYQTVPLGTGHIRPKYDPNEVDRIGMLGSLSRAYSLPEALMDLPDFDPLPGLTRPYLVVRPATIRREWPAYSRNPKPEYLAQFVEYARRFYTIVSVADLEGDEEYALEPLPYADIVYHAGELDTPKLLGLLQHADLVVGGVGFIVPACLANKTPLVCILGGNGGFNAPEIIAPPSQDIHHITFIEPDRFCRCKASRHLCDKTISDFQTKTETYFDEIQALCV
jgi:ADP-heptose:LPS heptosyltransferase